MNQLAMGVPERPHDAAPERVVVANEALALERCTDRGTEQLRERDDVAHFTAGSVSDDHHGPS